MGKTEVDNSWIKFDALIGIIASILIILLSIYVSPDYVARNLSPDGILSSSTINRINIIRTGVVIAGLLMLISSITSIILPNLLYYALKWLQKHEIIILVVIVLSALIYT